VLEVRTYFKSLNKYVRQVKILFSAQNKCLKVVNFSHEWELSKTANYASAELYQMELEIYLYIEIAKANELYYEHQPNYIRFNKGYCFLRPINFY
jgi:hypothetical protein